MPPWNFITNYGAVLGVVSRQSQITVREIASQLGITERTVLRILSDLAAEGYLQKYREARTNSYEVNHDQPLLGAQDKTIAVGELLKVLALVNQEDEERGE